MTEYTKLIEELDRISLHAKNNLAWWISPLASRQIHQSPLLRQMLQGSQTKSNSVLKCFALDVYALVTGLLRSLIAKAVGRNLKFSSTLFVETFFYRKCLKDKIFQDRYFKKLTDQLQEPFVYFGSFQSNRDFFLSLRDLGTLSEKCMILDQYLFFSDYLSAFRMIRHSRKHPPFTTSHEALVNEYRRTLGTSSFESLLIHRFFMRLKQRGMDIQFLLDWWENQNIDKALRLGLKQNFPQAQHIGYFGSPLFDNYLNHVPTQSEEALGLLPDQLLISNVVAFTEFTKLLKQTKISKAQYLRSPPSNDSYPRSNFCLVVFPYYQADTEMLTQDLMAILTQVDMPVVVRPHPFFPLKLPEVWSKKVTVDGLTPLPNLIQGCQVMVSMASTGIVEALDKGKRVLIRARVDDINYLPRVTAEAQKLMTICYSTAHLITALKGVVSAGEVATPQFFSKAETADFHINSSTHRSIPI